MIGELATFCLFIGVAWLIVLELHEWATKPRIVYVKPVRSRLNKLISFVGMPLVWLAIIVGNMVLT